MTDCFKQELEAFETEDIRDFTVLCIGDAPEYFYEISASSSGKYHPAPDLLEHGLVYHTKSIFKILNYILEVDKMLNIFDFDIRTRDMMRSAALLHDMFKSGSQSEYEKAEEKHTVFWHPILAYKMIMKHRDCRIINRKEICKIAEIVACHMGAFNTSTYEEGRLPVPALPWEKVVHLADYLASRKDIITEQPENYAVTVNSIGEGGKVC